MENSISKINKFVELLLSCIEMEKEKPCLTKRGTGEIVDRTLLFIL